MAPWNAPLILATRALATPLACGNTVILKGAELSPATQGLIIDALDAAGFPPGVVNYLTCAPEDAPALVESLIAHPAVRRVNFTGSTPVGRIIARTCGQYLKPAVLELGGKRPCWCWTMLILSKRRRALFLAPSPTPGRSACPPSALLSTMP